MTTAWYIVPYKIRHEDGMTSRYPAINDYTPQIFADGGEWSETEILGNRAVVKVRASDAVLATLNTKYKRLPKNRLDDSLSGLPTKIKKALKDEILDMGYSTEEIKAKFGSDIGQFTLRDVLKFVTKRRLKPRYVPETDTIAVDGVEQKCRPLEDVDRQVK